MSFVSLDGETAASALLVVETDDEALAEEELRNRLGPAIDIYFQAFDRETGKIEWWDVDESGTVLTVAWVDHRSGRDATVTIEDLGDAFGLQLSFDIEGACTPAASNRGETVEFGWALLAYEQRVSIDLGAPHDGRDFVDFSQPTRRRLRRQRRQAN